MGQIKNIKLHIVTDIKASVIIITTDRPLNQQTKNGCSYAKLSPPQSQYSSLVCHEHRAPKCRSGSNQDLRSRRSVRSCSLLSSIQVRCIGTSWTRAERSAIFIEFGSCICRILQRPDHQQV